jgi:hypothetical protein
MNWQGPIGQGDYPENEEKTVALGLHQPGIYIMFQKYPTFAAVYAGRAWNLKYRFHEHLANCLGYRYWLRKDAPTDNRLFDSELNGIRRSPKRHPIYLEHAYDFTQPYEEGLGMYNNIEQALRLSCREIRRTKFVYCRVPKPDDERHNDQCDLNYMPQQPMAKILATLESLLIDQLREISGNTPSPLYCDNGKRERAQLELQIEWGNFNEYLLQTAYGNTSQLV